MIEFKVTKNCKLKKAVMENIPLIKFTEYKKLVKNKDIKVNGKRTGEDVLLKVGDTVTVYYNQRAPFNVVYEDENVIIVNKLAGVTSEDCFNYLVNSREAYFIHRLDRNTEGLMVFALNKTAEKELLKGFKDRTFDKFYYAEVYGRINAQKARLTAYLLKDEAAGKVKIYSNKVIGAEKIITEYEVIDKTEETSILNVKLVTGKTHQIRAHLAYIGHFIIGDGKYGDEEINKKFKADKQRLKAYKIVFHFNKEDALYYLNDKSFEG